jgi:biopolymer transport protein ExbD
VKPETIRLSVDAQGEYYWNEQRISEPDMEKLLQAEAARTPQPELHIRGDKDVRYELVAQAMAAAQRAGVHKIGFITEPKAQ